jgi:ABC-type sugar transport system permease subunit
MNNTGLVKRIIEAKASYLLILPCVVILFTFKLFPTVLTFLMSLRYYRNVIDFVHVGLENYQYIFSDRAFWNAMRVTSVYTLWLAPGLTVISLMLAILLNRPSRLQNFWKTIYYIPVICSGVIIGVMWKWIYHGEVGILNYVISLVGIEPRIWLGSTSTALGAVIFVGLWKSVGYYMIIYLAGLQSIPGELYESASIDGANKFRCFFSITIPLMVPIIVTVLLLSFIGSFQAFDQIYIMTYGGPANSTSTLVWQMYYSGFIKSQPGEAAAIGVVIFFIILIMSVFQFKIFNKDLDGKRVK